MDGGSSEEGGSPPNKTHQNLVFADPAAFRYLEEDPSTTVLERRRKLQGYELYFVEQWACSRKHPTFVITTYTGLQEHFVIVGVLSVPTDEDAWSPRLRVYLTAIRKYHARARETPLGTLMVTNLSNFPSSLTVIHVPDGDLRAHREDFILNEDLKRLGCAGRAGLTLGNPNGATETKFRDMYHTSEKIPVHAAVIELVKLCQAALMMFGKLSIENCDGLLCDITEQKISDWWADIGGDYYNIEPADGILGPSTVAALLGLLMGARSRLHASGVSVGKDIFDVVSMKRAISQFQKAQHLERTRRLDRTTLDRLHRVTAKAASAESRSVPRVVKSTVAELSGKGNELVGAREKASIADVETFDLDDFISFGSGERFKWLWHGKPRRHEGPDLLNDLDDGLVLNDNGEGWTSKKKSVGDEMSPMHHISDRFYFHASSSSVDHLPPDQALRRAAIKNLAGKASDNRKGFGKIKNAVTRHGHHQTSLHQVDKLLKDEDLGDLRDSAGSAYQTSESSHPNQSSKSSASQSESNSPRSSRRPSKTDNIEHPRPRRIAHAKPASSRDTPKATSDREDGMGDTADVDSEMSDSVMDSIEHAKGVTSRQKAHRPVLERDRTLTTRDMQAIDKMQHFGWASSNLPNLRSTKSFSALLQQPRSTFWEQRFPRQASFSAVVDALSTSNLGEEADSKNAFALMSNEKLQELRDERLEYKLYLLKSRESSWVESKISQVDDLNKNCSVTKEKLDEVYHQKRNESHELHNFIQHLASERRTFINEAVKDVENLDAKLEYELQALQSKVEDVENGVDEFERQVMQLEVKVQELSDVKPPQRSWIRTWLGLGIF